MKIAHKRLCYAGASLLLFMAEWLISRTDGFLRVTVGDYWVVILIYTVIRVIFPVRPAPLKLSAGVFCFAFCVELTQYFHLIERLGLAGERMAHLTIGSTFDWGDVTAYALGCLTAWGADCLFRRKFF